MTTLIAWDLVNENIRTAVEKAILGVSPVRAVAGSKNGIRVHPRACFVHPHCNYSTWSISPISLNSYRTLLRRSRPLTVVDAVHVVVGNPDSAAGVLGPSLRAARKGEDGSSDGRSKTHVEDGLDGCRDGCSELSGCVKEV